MFLFVLVHAQAEWFATHLDEAKDLCELLKVIHLIAPNAAGAERNWSIQDFIFSRRRNRLNGERGTRLVYIYWNLRMLERRLVREGDVVDEWRSACCTSRAGFPHPTIRWTPFSNWGSSMHGSFVGMHGDEMRGDAAEEEEEEEEEEVDAEPPHDWEVPEHEALQHCPAADPEDMTSGVRVGDRVVAWFTTPYNDWFVGTVTKVDKRRRLPVHAEFEDGEADLCLDRALYGVSRGREWALLQQGEQRRPAIIDVEEDTSDDGDADADADDPIDRVDIHDLDSESS